MRNVAKSTDEVRNGMEFNAPTLFGEYLEIYDLLLVRYINQVDGESEPSQIIANHIENGIHKMGHVKKLEDVVALK